MTLAAKLALACGCLATVVRAQGVPGRDCCHGHDVANLCYSWFQDGHSCPETLQPMDSCDCHEPRDSAGNTDLSEATCCLNTCSKSHLDQGDCPAGTILRPEWDSFSCDGDCNAEQCCITNCYSAGFTDRSDCPAGEIPRGRDDFHHGGHVEHADGTWGPTYNEDECCYPEPVPGRDCCHGNDVTNLCYSWFNEGHECPIETLPRDSCDCHEPWDHTTGTVVLSEEGCCMRTCFSSGFDPDSCPDGTVPRGEHDHHQPGHISADECCVRTCFSSGWTHDTCPDETEPRGEGDYHQPSVAHWPPTEGDFTEGECCMGHHQGHHQAMCNFGEMMAEIQHAMDLNDMNPDDPVGAADYLRASVVVGECMRVGEEIANAECGGQDHHDDDDDDDDDDYPVNSCGYHQWGADRDGYMKCPNGTQPYPEQSPPLRDTFADDAESCCESTCHDASEPLPPWTQSEMEYITQHCQPSFTECFPDTWHNPFMGEYCDFMPSLCYEAIRACDGFDTPADCASAGCEYMPDFRQTPDGNFTDACLPVDQTARAAIACYEEKSPEWDAQYDGERAVDYDSRFVECTARHAHSEGDMSCCVGGDVPCDYPDLGIGSGRRLQDSFAAESSKRQLGHCCDAELFCQCMAGEDTCLFAQRETAECAP